jgi:hypothetical protein
MSDDAGYGDTTFVRTKGGPMKTLHTHIPPTLVEEPGDGWYVELFVQFEDGETTAVRAPVGDGRYWAQQTVDKIIMPALGDLALAKRQLQP